MKHLIVFINFFILALGIGMAFMLFRRYLSKRDSKTFWLLVLFLAFTMTMAVAALDAYVVVNIGFELFMSRLLTCLVILGSSLMLFSLPQGAWARIGVKPEKTKTMVWAFLSSLTALAGILVLFVAVNPWVIILIVIAFIPFLISIVYSLSIEMALQKKKDWSTILVLFVLFAIAAFEINWVIRHPQKDGIILITLPFAYLYHCWIFWKDFFKSGLSEQNPIELTFPEALGKEKGLSARELEIGAGILEGKSNKELAFELGISENTIRNHIYNLYKKLGIQKRIDMVLLVRKYHAV